MKLGVIMDPIETLNSAKDTTLGMLAAAQRGGWTTTYFTANDISLHNGEVYGRGRGVRVELEASPDASWFALEDARYAPLAELDAILIRKDPPVDEVYANLCHILARVPGRRVFNRPESLLELNEKVFAQWFPSLQPPTLVSADARQILAFVAEHEEAVIKPLNGMQGWSVFRLAKDDVNAVALIEEVTARGARFGVAQALIPEYVEGDLRVLLIDGEPLPYALLRVPPKGQLRANMAAGGAPQVLELADTAAEICAAVGPELKARGLFFVGLDIIGGRLTEINVTSPTGWREIDASAPIDVGAMWLSALQAKVAKH